MPALYQNRRGSARKNDASHSEETTPQDSRGRAAGTKKRASAGKAPRSNPWFRFYSEALNDPKVQALAGDLFKAWVNLLALSNMDRSGQGRLPPLKDIAFHLRLSLDEANNYVNELIERELLDQSPEGLVPHNWEVRQFKSDCSTARVRKHREKQSDRPRNGDGTLPETLHETACNDTPKRFPSGSGSGSGSVDTKYPSKRKKYLEAHARGTNGKTRAANGNAYALEKEGIPQ
jgi:hypothetical protein